VKMTRKRIKNNKSRSKRMRSTWMEWEWAMAKEEKKTCLKRLSMKSSSRDLRTMRVIKSRRKKRRRTKKMTIRKKMVKIMISR
jgi:hypothetical protein